MICLVAYQLLSKGSKKPSNNVKFINMRPILLRFFRLFLGVVLIFLLAACASATMEAPVPEATATLPLAPTATAVIKSQHHTFTNSHPNGDPNTGSTSLRPAGRHAV
jgi:hypothetical protein